MKPMMAVGLGVVLLLASSAPVTAQKGKDEKDIVVQGKTIGEWIKTLESKDADARFSALVALGNAGPTARQAAPAVVELFAAPDPALGVNATFTLKFIGADAVPALQKGLVDKRSSVRRMAARTLGLIGEEARSAASVLVKALKDAEPDVRAAAAAALGRLGRSARPGLSALAAALDDGDLTVQVEAGIALWRISGDVRGVAVLSKAARGDDLQALATLGEMGAKAKEAVPVVREALASKDTSVRIAAAVALYRITKDVTASLPVLEALVRSDTDDRRAAVSALGELGADEQARVILVRLLGDKSAELRREAASSLTSPGVSIGPIISVLETGLTDADAGVRWWCAVALGGGDGDVRKHEEEILRAFRLPMVEQRKGGPIWRDVVEPVRAVSALAQVLKTRPARLQLEAARTLGQGWLQTDDARGPLVEALRGDDKLLRRAAAEALAASVAAEVLPELLKLMGSGDAREREGAARALGQMGVKVRSAMPALTRLLKDPEAAVRTQAALALWRIDRNAEQTLPILNLVLKDVDNADRWEAVEAVGVIAAEARPAIKGITEVLVVALKDRDPRVRAQASRSLWRRTRDAKVIVPLLTDVVRDRDMLARRIAVETLGEMTAEERAVPLLMQALDDREISLRLLATEGLARGGVAVVPALITSLDAKSPRVRQGVVRALGMIGPQSKKTAAALEKLTKDPDAAVRAAAAEALRAIGGVSP